jgi:hypothetical protein
MKKHKVLKKNPRSFRGGEFGQEEKFKGKVFCLES